MRNTQEYTSLYDMCARDGCVICRLVLENTSRYLEHWKYELFTDVGVRQELRRARGFCHRHTWQLARMGASLQLAQAYRDIISDTVERLQQGEAVMGRFRRLKETKREQGSCPACRSEVKAEERYIHTLRRALLEEEFYERFSTSHGLCLEHFRQACEAKMVGDWLTRLRAAQLLCLQRLDEQLGELIRKHDYRFRDEPHGPEMVSWKYAAGIVAGEE
jgi:uncharacterized protein DUF6062